MRGQRSEQNPPSKGDMRRADAISAALKQHTTEYQQLSALDAMIEDLTLNRLPEQNRPDKGTASGNVRRGFSGGLRGFFDELLGPPSGKTADDQALEQMIGTPQPPEAGLTTPPQKAGMPIRPGGSNPRVNISRAHRKRQRATVMIVLQIWLVIMLVGVLLYLRGLI